MNVLVVDGYGAKIFVRRNCVVLENAKSRRVLPIADIDRVVVVTSGVSITSRAVRTLARYGIDIVFLDSRGVPITCLTPPWQTATVATRRAQYLAYSNRFKATEIAKSFAEAKIMNQGLYIKYLSKNLGIKDLEKESENILKHVEVLKQISGDIEETRQKIINVEALAARIYWSAIATVLPRDLGFDGRDQDGVDQVNKALNYLYGVLYTECFKALTRHGLDPYAGFLHSDRSGNPTLVFDFVEMFRVSAVDSLLVKLFSSGFRIKVDERGFISKDDRTRLVNEFYKWVDRRTRDLNGDLRKVREHVNSYAMGFGKSLRENTLFRGFVERWWQ